ncbi:MAG: hypothetical protein EBV17_04335 [Actinobacteria bacterium]|nr:hypothetical protein [Actinomycetota bacterium]
MTVLTYRIAQYWLPILVGGVSYLSLRIGAVAPVPTPQSRLSRIESATRAGSAVRESKAGWIEKYAPRDRTGLYPLPHYDDTGEQPETHRSDGSRDERPPSDGSRDDA